MPKITNTLKSWLLNKPVIFTFMSVIYVSIFSLIGGFIGSIFNLSESTTAVIMFIMIALSFVYPIYSLIKKLPHDKMYRNDFIAIVNGANIISLVASLIALFAAGLYGPTLERDLMFMHMLHPTIFGILFVIFILSTLYLLGVAISAVYAKYKRCKQIGIDKWKIILSMPFSFLMLWTPGYLIDEKGNKSVMEIKSGWYSKFNRWVVSNFSNTLFVFLFLLLSKNIISGTITLLLSLSLLIIYTLWYVKHKTDFIKNINRGYAITAVCINILIIAVMLLQHV